MFTPKERDAIWHEYWAGAPATPVVLPTWETDESAPQRKQFDPLPPIWEVLLDGRIRLLPSDPE